MAKKTWGYSPDKSKKPKVPDKIKNEVIQLALEFVNTKLKPKHIKDIPTEAERNYIVDIVTKWYRNYFSFIAVYKTNHPDFLDKVLEIKFARIEYVNETTYKLSYMRHTGQWFEVYQESSVEKCFNIIEADSLFFP